MLGRLFRVDDAADERMTSGRGNPRPTRDASARKYRAQSTEVRVGGRRRGPLVLAKLRSDLVRGDYVRFRQALSQLIGDRRLVNGSEREERADSDGLGVELWKRVEVERHEHAVGPHTLAHAVAVLERNERLGMFGAQPVEMRAVLPAQMKQVLGSGRGDERRAGTLALE